MSIEEYSAQSGRMLRDDNTVVNIADTIKPDPDGYQQVASKTKEHVFHNAVTAVGDGEEMDVVGLDSVTFHILGSTTSHTLVFEASVDGTNWETYPAIQTSDTQYPSAKQTSGTGIWQAYVKGLKKFRVRISEIQGELTIPALGVA